MHLVNLQHTYIRIMLALFSPLSWLHILANEVQTHSSKRAMRFFVFFCVFLCFFAHVLASFLHNAARGSYKELQRGKLTVLQPPDVNMKLKEQVHLVAILMCKEDKT